MATTAVKKLVFTGHKGPVYTVTESGVPGIVITGSSDQLIGSWSLRDGAQGEFSAFMPTHIIALEGLSDPHRIIAGTSGGTVHFIDPANKKEIRAEKYFDSQVFELTSSVRHQLLFASSGDGRIVVSDLISFEKLKTLQICNDKIRGIAVHPHDDVVAVASSDGAIRIFSLPLMKEIKSFHAHNLAANALSWHPEGKYLISGGRDAYLNVWNPDEDFAQIHSIAAHNYAIYSIAFSPDKKYFATASRDKTIKIWDAGKIELLLRINKENHDGHVNSVNKVIWNECGLISTGDDRAVIVWDIRHD